MGPSLPGFRASESLPYISAILMPLTGDTHSRVCWKFSPVLFTPLKEACYSRSWLQFPVRNQPAKEGWNYYGVWIDAGLLTPSFCWAAPSGCRFCRLGNLTFGFERILYSLLLELGSRHWSSKTTSSSSSLCSDHLSKGPWQMGCSFRDNAGKGDPRVSQAYLCFRFSLSELYNENQCRARPKLTKGPTPLPLKTGGCLWTSSASLQKEVTTAHSLLLAAVQRPG